jgi:hypothetical protein
MSELPQGELRVYDEDHKPIGILPNVKALNVAWALNEITPATFTMPMDVSRWNTKYIRELHRVEYHHPNLPHPWIGVILEPAGTWPEATINCNDPKWLYSKRFTEKYLATVGTETAGQIAQILHGQATLRSPLGIQCGEMDRTGPGYFVQYQLQRVSEALDQLADMTGGSWWVEKTGTTHRDPWLLRYARTFGQDRSGDVVLCAEIADNPNVKKSAAQIATAVHILGAASGSGNGDVEDRLYLYRLHKPSVSLYGLLEERLEFPDVIDPTLLDEAGSRELYRLTKPLRTLALNIDNRRDVWGKFWLGDTVRAIISNVDYAGLDLKVQVKGIQLDGDGQKLGLVVEVPL